MLSSVTRVQADPEVISCAFGEGEALLDLRSGQYFTVNSVGAFVWKLLGEPVSVDAIKDAVLAEYDATEQRCSDDVQALLGNMIEAKLIRASDAPAA